MIHATSSMMLAILLLAAAWRRSDDMSNLSLSLLALFVFCLLMFAFVHIALPKINIIKLVNTELNDKSSEKIFIVAILFFFLVFIL